MVTEIPTDEPGGPPCFPGDATVRSGGVLRSMRDVQVGETIGGGVVVAHTHREETLARFVRVVAGNYSVRLSGGHLIPLSRGTVRADGVRVGDMVRTEGGWRGVDSVGNVWGRGLYAPVTQTGWMVVDGVRVSCYTDDVGHWVSHALLTPVRAMVRVLVWDVCRVVDVLRAVFVGLNVV